MRILNPEQIDAYLAGFFPNDAVAAAHLHTALRKPLGKEHAAYREVFGHSKRFVPNKALTDRVQHVADWIASALAEGDKWLEDKDKDGRPKKLLQFYRLEDAIKEADRIMRQKNQRLAKNLTLSDGDEQEVMPLADGYRIVQLLSKEALDREGVLMGQCLGLGAYDNKLTKRTRQFFSLRDPANQPHVTMETNPATNNLLQCRGKANDPPTLRYMPYIQEFIKARKFNLKTETRYTNLLKRGSQYYDIMHLPDPFHWVGDLDLMDTLVEKLPNRCKVRGHIYLSHSKIKELPEFLEAPYISANNTVIASVPRHLKTRNLQIDKTKVRELPDNFTVDTLNITDTPIRTLPKGLKAERVIVNKGQIAHWPADAQIGCRVEIDGGVVTEHYFNSPNGGYSRHTFSSAITGPSGRSY